MSKFVQVRFAPIVVKNLLLPDAESKAWTPL